MAKYEHLSKEAIFAPYFPIAITFPGSKQATASQNVRRSYISNHVIHPRLDAGYWKVPESAEVVPNGSLYYSGEIEFHVNTRGPTLVN